MGIHRDGWDGMGMAHDVSGSIGIHRDEDAGPSDGDGWGWSGCSMMRDDHGVDGVDEDGP